MNSRTMRRFRADREPRWCVRADRLRVSRGGPWLARRSTIPDVDPRPTPARPPNIGPVGPPPAITTACSVIARSRPASRRSPPAHAASLSRRLHGVCKTAPRRKPSWIPADLPPSMFDRRPPRGRVSLNAGCRDSPRPRGCRWRRLSRFPRGRSWEEACRVRQRAPFRRLSSRRSSGLTRAAEAVVRPDGRAAETWPSPFPPPRRSPSHFLDQLRARVRRVSRADAQLRDPPH